MNPAWYFAACLAGAAGACARFGLDTFTRRYLHSWQARRRAQAPSPLADTPAAEETVVPVEAFLGAGIACVNLLGCFLAGLAAGSLATSYPGAYLLVAGGFLGGFTTFSTAALDAAKLIFARRMGRALLLLGAVYGGGLLAVWVGLALAA